jgi:hypothetical protein
MTNLKDYRNKELRYYLIANIAVLLLLLDFFQIPQLDNGVQMTVLIYNFFRITVLSSTIFVLSFVADSLFSSELKNLLIIGRSPGEKIFSKIRKGKFEKRFSKDDALKIYSSIYESLPQKKKKRYAYENDKWYKIYNKHREISMIQVSHRDFLLCRDIYFSTIICIVIYLVLTIVFQTIAFDWRYIGYLTVMLIISNIGTRNRGMRFVSNVIAYDITNQKKGNKIEGE